MYKPYNSIPHINYRNLSLSAKIASCPMYSAKSTSLKTSNQWNFSFLYIFFPFQNYQIIEVMWHVAFYFSAEWGTMNLMHARQTFTAVIPSQPTWNLWLWILSSFTSSSLRFTHPSEGTRADPLFLTKSYSILWRWYISLSF